MPYIECNCGRKFNRDEVKQLRQDIQDSDYEQAANRLKEYINTLCMFCCNKLNETGQKENKHSSHIVKLQPETGNDKGIEFLDIPHHICHTCYTDKVWLGGGRDETATDDEGENEEQTKNDKRERRSKQKPKAQDKDMCKICYKKHIIIGKDNNVSCCGVGCIIY